MPRVTARLPDQSFENERRIREMLGTKSGAETVSIALSFTRKVHDLLKRFPGKDLVLRSSEGQLEKVIYPEGNIPPKGKLAG